MQVEIVQTPSEPILEDYISLQRAAALMDVSHATVKRYANGYHDVVLETRKVGGRRKTTRVWIENFIADVSKVSGCRAVVRSVEEANMDGVRDRVRAALGLDAVEDQR